MRRQGSSRAGMREQDPVARRIEMLAVQSNACNRRPACARLSMCLPRLFHEAEAPHGGAVAFSYVWFIQLNRCSSTTLSLFAWSCIRVHLGKLCRQGQRVHSISLLTYVQVESMIQPNTPSNNARTTLCLVPYKFTQYLSVHVQHINTPKGSVRLNPQSGHRNIITVTDD